MVCSVARSFFFVQTGDCWCKFASFRSGFTCHRCSGSQGRLRNSFPPARRTLAAPVTSVNTFLQPYLPGTVAKAMVHNWAARAFTKHTADESERMMVHVHGRLFFPREPHFYPGSVARIRSSDFRHLFLCAFFGRSTSCSAALPVAETASSISHLMFSTSTRNLLCNLLVSPLASWSDSRLAALGAHSTTAFEAMRFKKLLDISLLKAEPLPRLSVHVGTINILVRCRGARSP